MIAEILVVSEQSEVLVRKIYRNEAKRYNGGQIFSKRLKEINEGLVEPYFEVEDIHFYFIHRGSLYFVATSINKVSHVVISEFLSRLYHMAKDLCGAVTEESVRINYFVIFELLCDAMDGGCVQLVHTEKIKPYIQTEPVAVGRSPSTQEELASRMFGIDNRVTPEKAAQRQNVPSSVEQNEIYLDLIEKMTAVASSKGEVERLKVDGVLKVNNCLRGQPTIKIAVNKDLLVCSPGQVRAYGKSAILDSCNFHQSVDTKEFETHRVLKIAPPPGQFSAMTYCVEGPPLNLPVLIRIFIDDIPESRDVNVTIRVGLRIPESSRAFKIHITLPVPPSVSSVSQQVQGPSESLVFKDKEKAVDWTIQNLTQAEESIAYLRLISHSSQPITRKDIGPAMVEFELFSLSLSGLSVRYLKIAQPGQSAGPPPKQFIRCLTVSDSYTVKTV